jgi:membrane-bound lytic murein transglycosylase F
MAVRPNTNDCYLYRSEAVGFHLELIQAYAYACGQVYRIYYEEDEEMRWQALLQGKITILVCNYNDSLLHQYRQQHKVFYSAVLEDYANSVWVVNEKNRHLLTSINEWIVYYLSTQEYEIKKQNYFVFRNPENIRPQTELSVYDRIIKRCAKYLNWDWRLLASLIYQESRFRPEAMSHRGAYGLMQITPATADHYLLYDIEGAENNIEAGTKILRDLQRDIANDTASEYDNNCFILAAYNAGKNRIIQCRQFAELQDKNQYVWEEVAAVIPLMKHPVYYESDIYNISRFKGAETLNYVEKIMERYELYKVLLPE